MKIEFAFPDNLSKREIYKLCQSPDVERLSDNVGAVIELDALIVYKEEQTNKDTGEPTETTVVALRDHSSGTVYATNSTFFRQEVMDIFNNVYDPADPEPLCVEVYQGQSKKGRPFMGAKLV